MVVLGLLLVAAAESRDSVAKERKALQGTWVVVSSEEFGRAGDFEGVKFMFSSDTETIDREGKKYSTRFKLNRTTTPKHIDIQQKDNEPTVLGIYSVEADRMRMCYWIERPAEFTSANGILLILKRAP